MFITKLFKHTNLKIAFKTNNSIEYKLRPKRQCSQTKSKKASLFSGIYKLACPDCARRMLARLVDALLKDLKNIFFLSFRDNNYTSKFPQHLMEYGHSFDKMENIMQIIHFNKKGAHMDS
jgi:hypothetical protein